MDLLAGNLDLFLGIFWLIPISPSPFPLPPSPSPSRHLLDRGAAARAV